MNTNAVIQNRTFNLSNRQKQWILVLIAILMTVLSTEVLRDVGEPQPQVNIMLIKGFIMALILNAGLWASTLMPTGIWRFPIALYLIPESIGAGFILSSWSWTLGIIGIIFHLMLAGKILRRKKLT